MLELGFNTTEYGKVILASCFINDLGTVIALGLIFAPFSLRTAVFVIVSVVVFVALPFVTPRFFRRYGGRVSELEAKFILLALFARLVPTRVPLAQLVGGEGDQGRDQVLPAIDAVREDGNAADGQADADLEHHQRRVHVDRERCRAAGGVGG